jgi:CRP-like cAMP-binding protein
MCHELQGPDGGRLEETARGLPSVARVPLVVGAHLYERGSHAPAIYVVHQGIVKETMPTADGGVCIVRLVMTHGVAGLCGLIEVPQRHTAVVMHPGTACRIPMERLHWLREHRPSVAERIELSWLQSTDDSDMILANLTHGSGRARLASALLYLRSSLAPGEPLLLHRSDLTELLALTPVTIARLLAEFRRAGLLHEDRRYCVDVDVARLKDIAAGKQGRRRVPRVSPS